MTTTHFDNSKAGSAFDSEELFTDLADQRSRKVVETSFLVALFFAGIIGFAYCFFNQ